MVNVEHRTVLKEIGKAFILAGAFCLIAYFIGDHLAEKG